MDGEPSWISVTVATVLFAIASVLLIILIAHSAQLHNAAHQVDYSRANTLIALRLLK